MSNIKVSVVIPVYNVEKYINTCVESVRKQTMKEIEIILVNDGSTDDSVRICKQLAEKDSRIKFISQSNQGVSVARNRGIEEAKGNWIVFIDSDDWIEPNYVEFLYDAAVSYNADISVCGFYFDYSHETVPRGHFEQDRLFVGNEEIEQIQIQILAKNMSQIKNNSGDRIGAPWCKMYSTKYIRENNLKFIPDLKRSQDVVFNLYALQAAEIVVYKNVSLYHYRINEESVCNKFSKLILANVNRYLWEMKKFIEKYHSSDPVFEDAFNTKVCTSVYKCLIQYFFDDQYPGTSKEMKTELKQYINQDVFKKALENVKYKNLETTEKIFVFCLKHEMLTTLQLLVGARQKFIKTIRH